MVVALGGCGAWTDYGNTPTGVATSYFHLLYNNDYAGACKLFTDDLRKQLGDCPGKLRTAVGHLTVDDRQQLRDVQVRHVADTNGTAHVYLSDVRVDATLAPKTVKGTPKPRKTTVFSAAAQGLTNGKGLELTKVGKNWLISSCGLS